MIRKVLGCKQDQSHLGTDLLPKGFFLQKEREVFLISAPHTPQALTGEKKIETAFYLNAIHNLFKSRPTQ